MDGDSAPLRALSDVAKQQNASGLLVDDAYGIGVMGEDGRGSASPTRHEAGTADRHLWQRRWREQGRRAVQRVRRRLSAAIRPTSDLQHQYTAWAQAVAFPASLEVIRGEEGAERARPAEHIQRFRQV